MGLFCPIISANLRVEDCGITRCSYRSEAGGCIEASLRSIPPVGEPGRAEAISRIFCISRSDLQQDVENIQSVEVLRQYIQYLLEKDLTEINLNDVEKIKNSKSSYEAWSGCRGKKPRFSAVTYTLELILPRL